MGRLCGATVFGDARNKAGFRWHFDLLHYQPGRGFKECGTNGGLGLWGRSLFGGGDRGGLPNSGNGIAKILNHRAHGEKHVTDFSVVFIWALPVLCGSRFFGFL